MAESWLPDVEARALCQVPGLHTDGNGATLQHRIKSSRPVCSSSCKQRLFPVFELTTNGCPTKGKQQQSKQTTLFPKESF